jgi:peptidoglycan/xylan/chitin deacetylase (PgdA/CDA1 family)
VTRRALLLAAVLLLAAALPAARAAAAPTIVSIQFDDGRGQDAVRAILAKHHVHATFFINSGYVGTPGYLTWKRLHELAADGNEIAGHTLTHRNLARLTPDEQRREICGDRNALIAQGLQPTDFAYPFGSYTKATKKIVRQCGYASGRAAWGLWGSRCEERPADCPYSEDPNNLTDRWALLTAAAPIDLTGVDDVRRDVTNAQEHGGGWVQIFWHRICPDDCDKYSWPPELLDEFLGWLETQTMTGAVQVKTSQEVLGGAFNAAVEPPAPPAPPKGPNLLRAAKRCLERQGGGDWKRVAGPNGHTAQQVTLRDAPDGFVALATPQDQGDCAPAVRPGRRLIVRTTYRSTGGPRLLAWVRSTAGGWRYWRQGPRLAPTRGYASASWAVPPVPRGVAAVAVGVGLSGDGTLAVAGLELRRR